MMQKNETYVKGVTHMNEANVVKERLYAMTEEEFERFNKHFSDDVQKIFAGMRFFHKMFNNAEMYDAVREAIGERLYETLRAEG